MMQPVKPRFSICICNRNMSNTLRTSLSSILKQIDSRFEVVVVDDGSTDDSLNILTELAEKNSNLRVISLPRDSTRKLGSTRNISIQNALGDWVILHLDADDFIDEGILDFVTQVLSINDVDPTPALYSGHQIHMAPKDWLLDLGPYRNLYRLEDRDLYQRLIPTNQWRIINHTNFIHRLERKRNSQLVKTFRDAFEHLVSDTRYASSFSESLNKEWFRKSSNKRLLRIFRMFALPYAYKVGRRLGEISRDWGDFSDQGVRLYREENSRSTEEWKNFLANSN